MITNKFSARSALFVLIVLCLLFKISNSGAASGARQQSKDLALPQEKHLKNIRQLTFAGENAEAYFSPDDQRLIFQSTRDGNGCDQIYSMKIDGSDVKLLSNGKGRTTCSYF